MGTLGAIILTVLITLTISYIVGLFMIKRCALTTGDEGYPVGLITITDGRLTLTTLDTKRVYHPTSLEEVERAIRQCEMF